MASSYRPWSSNASAVRGLLMLAGRAELAVKVKGPCWACWLCGKPMPKKGTGTRFCSKGCEEENARGVEMWKQAPKWMFEARKALFR